jgi:hypothetical protein
MVNRTIDELMLLSIKYFISQGIFSLLYLLHCGMVPLIINKYAWFAITILVTAQLMVNEDRYYGEEIGCPKTMLSGT